MFHGLLDVYWKVLDVKFVGRIQKALVKWKGWGPEHATKAFHKLQKNVF